MRLAPDQPNDIVALATGAGISRSTGARIVEAVGAIGCVGLGGAAEHLASSLSAGFAITARLVLCRITR